MPKLRLVLTLMVVMAAIIIGIAVYLAVNYSAMNLTQGVVLIAIAVVGLLVFMGVLIVAIRNPGPSSRRGDKKNLL